MEQLWKEEPCSLVGCAAHGPTKKTRQQQYGMTQSWCLTGRQSGSDDRWWPCPYQMPTKMQKHLWYWALLKQARGFQIFIYLFILQPKHWQSERTQCMAARLLDFAYPNDADLNDAFYPHLKSGYNNSDFISLLQIDRTKSFKAQLESCPCLWIAGTDFTSMRCLLGCWRIEPTLRSFDDTKFKSRTEIMQKNAWKSIFASK